MFLSPLLLLLPLTAGVFGQQDSALKFLSDCKSDSVITEDFKTVARNRLDLHELCFDISTEVTNIEKLKYLMEMAQGPEKYHYRKLRWSIDRVVVKVFKMLLNSSKLEPEATDRNILQAAGKGRMYNVVLGAASEGLKLNPSIELIARLGNGEVRFNRIMELLEKSGANATAFDNEAICSVCMHMPTAAELIKVLLKKGANSKARDNTPIRRAAEAGNLEAVKILLENGADPAASDNLPVLVAASSGHAKVVKLLLDHGASMSTRAMEILNEIGFKSNREVMNLIMMDHGVQKQTLDYFTKEEMSDHVITYVGHQVKYFDYFYLSRVNGSQLIPGKSEFSVALHLIDELCSAAKDITLEFLGPNAPGVRVSKINSVKNLCTLDLEIAWPKNLSPFASGGELTMIGSFKLNDYFSLGIGSSSFILGSDEVGLFDFTIPLKRYLLIGCVAFVILLSNLIGLLIGRRRRRAAF